MKSRISLAAFCLLALLCVARAQEAKRQLIVPLKEGGFVSFKSETSWTDSKKAASELQSIPGELSSQALLDDNHIIHRVLEDKTGKYIFGYDLWVTPNPSARQFKIAVRPLDSEFERKLRPERSQRETIATFPRATTTRMIDDGGAFSLDLLVNENSGVKIVDIVSVTFDKSNIREFNPRTLPRDFTLDAVELSVKDYQLLIDGIPIVSGKAKGCSGALVWLYVRERGRFIFSLVPREGYPFQKVGVIEANRIDFTLNGKHYEWISSAPVLRGGGTWNLWVLEDPTYVPSEGKKSILDKWNDDAKSAEDRARAIRNQGPNTHNTGAPSGSQAGPRIVVGGADKIEKLWPKN